LFSTGLTAAEGFPFPPVFTGKGRRGEGREKRKGEKGKGGKEQGRDLAKDGKT